MLKKCDAKAGNKTLSIFSLYTKLYQRSLGSKLCGYFGLAYDWNRRSELEAVRKGLGRGLKRQNLKRRNMVE